MYCPMCSQLQISDDVGFCSRCGLRLSDLRRLVSATPKGDDSNPRLTPRQRGIRQGVVLMLLSIILIPAYILLAALFPANDRLIESAVSDTPFEKISQALLFTIFMLGLARVLYARFFQSATRVDEQFSSVATLESATNYSLPAPPDTQVSGFGSWRETGELVKRD